MTKASQLNASDQGWRELPVTEYQFNREARTVTVRVLPGEALLVKRCHDTGISLPINKITIAGADGEVSFQGEQAFKAFVKQTDTLFTLTYK